MGGTGSIACGHLSKEFPEQPAGCLCMPGLCSAEKLFPPRMGDNFLAVTAINFLKLAD